MRVAVRCRIDTHADQHSAGSGDTAAFERKGAFFLVERFNTIGVLSEIERDKRLAGVVNVRVARKADDVFDLLPPHTNLNFRKFAVLRGFADDLTIDFSDMDFLDAAAVGR